MALSPRPFAWWWHSGWRMSAPAECMVWEPRVGVGGWVVVGRMQQLAFATKRPPLPPTPSLLGYPRLSASPSPNRHSASPTHGDGGR